MKKEKSIDNLLDSLTECQSVSPNEEFLRQLEQRAISFAEIKAKYGSIFIALMIFVLGLIIGLNVRTIQESTTSKKDSKIENTEYDVVPIKTIEYE